MDERGGSLDAGRHYRVVSLLGRGGFGSVYRARMERADGFTKDVAIKLLRDDDVPTTVLKRFRDEARILGLVRDRAIVGVDPPTRLDGRWAIVMEYVEGASVHRLVSVAPIPPTVALGIVAEVSRALDKVFRQEGPDGAPLRLVHRDLKPGNIQVTPDGDVKLLDFGIATASFEARETKTSMHIGGTLGYIAPERLVGVEGPEGDVYSLGVLLHVMVTTERATDLGRRERTPRHAVERTDEVEQVLELAAAMRASNTEDRPSAREVEDRCRALLVELEGPRLARWADTAVREAMRSKQDELTGTVLSETLTVLPLHTDEAPAPVVAQSRKAVGASLVVGGAMGAAGLAVAAAALLIAAGVGVWAWTQQPEVIAVSAAVEAPKVAPPEPDPVAVGEPEPVAAEEPVEEPPVAAPEPAAAPQPVAVAPAPAPAPAQTRPAPRTPKVSLVSATIESDPPGAAVFIDGVRVGTTPLRALPVSTGTHELKLTRGGDSIVRQVRIGGRRGNTAFSWSGDQLVAR